MRPLGLILIGLGIISFSISSITYYSTERNVGPFGFFAWDVTQPHTIFLSPLTGIVTLIVGITLVLMGPSFNQRLKRCHY